MCYVCAATFTRESTAQKKVTDHTTEKGKYVRVGAWL